MAILALLISISAFILLYGVGHPFIFWFQLVNTILFLVNSIVIPNLIAMSAMKKFKARVEEAHEQGATDEEIDWILKEEEIEIAEEDEQVVPQWMYIIGLISLVISIILLITGVIIRF